MASNGLFTQGLSIDDLLQQRRARSQAQQQQMADSAAQGAADPQRARMGSMFGSILGRAMGNANGGGEDKQVEALKARDATRAGLVKEYATAASNTNVPAMYQSANNLIQTGDPQALQMGTSLLRRADQLNAQQASEATAKTNIDTQALIDNDLADDVEDNVPASVVKALRRGGTGAKEARTFAYKSLEVKEAKESALAVKVRDAFGYKIGSDKSRAQMQIEMAKTGQGQKISITLNEKGNQPLSQAVKSTLQKGVLDSYENLVKLDSISENFDPSYFTTYGVAKAATGALLDRTFGVSSEDDPTGSVNFNAKRTVAVAEIDMLFNQYRKEITGAAAAVKELEALKKSYLNSERGPEATMAMLKNLQRIGQHGYETKKLNLREGLAVGDTLIFHDDPEPEGIAPDLNDAKDYEAMSNAQIIEDYNALQLKNKRKP